jgi:hypothetical protein
VKPWALGACIALFGVVFVTGLELGYEHRSDLDGEPIGVGDLAWNLVIAAPLLFLGLLAWRAQVSSVALGVGVLVSSAIVWAGYHAAWTDESSTAGFALLVAPMYALLAAAVILALDRIVDAVRRRRATES